MTIKFNGLAAVSTFSASDILAISLAGANGSRKMTYTQLFGDAFAAVGQLKFPASQNASSDANTLDDYEEGTWTPNDASGASLSFSAAAGRYTKVGRMVFFQMLVQYPSTANGNNAAIGGLPFTIGGSTEGRAGAGAALHDVGAAVACLLNSGGTDIQPRDGDNVVTNKTNAQFSTKQLYLGGSYIL